MVATAVSEVVHVTVLSVASSGLTVAMRVALSPSTISKEVLSRVTDVTAMMFLATVTLQVASLSPAFAVIVAVPSFTAVTSPFTTVAMASSEDVQVTVLSVALSGVTVAVRVALAPSTRFRDSLSNLMDSTGTNAAVTVTLQVASFAPALAVMVAVPAFTAFTLPSATVATASSEEVQVTILSVASSGFTVAFNSASWPSTRVNSALSRVTSETSTLGTPACLTVNF